MINLILKMKLENTSWKKFSAIIVAILLIGMPLGVAATTTFFQEELTKTQEEVLVSEEGCGSLLYSIVLKIIKDFTFEVITYDTEEHFYITLLENDCKWSYEVLSEYSQHPDVTVYFNYLDEDGVAKIKYHTLKGFLLYRLVKDEI